MKKKVFYFIVFCFYGFISCSGKAQVLHSDLTLLKGAPQLDEEVVIDPYWELAWHAKVAEYGDPESQFLVAQIYEQGKLVPQDNKKAVAYYQKAANQGHMESCMRLGYIYNDKSKRVYDKDKSIFWYKKAAEKGYVPAQIKLSHLYEEEQDYSQAIEWLTSAMRTLFPDKDDLTQVSPDLERLIKLEREKI